jgi:hypothetical protein
LPPFSLPFFIFLLFLLFPSKQNGGFELGEPVGKLVGEPFDVGDLVDRPIGAGNFVERVIGAGNLDDLCGAIVGIVTTGVDGVIGVVGIMGAVGGVDGVIGVVGIMGAVGVIGIEVAIDGVGPAGMGVLDTGTTVVLGALVTASGQISLDGSSNSV